MTDPRGTLDKATPADDSERTVRIGKVARLCGVTTRTLRYWEEIGLVAPSGQRHGSERVYSGSEVERAQRIRELQVLLGFSLAEIRVVLETEDVLDKLRSAYKATARAEIQRQLLVEAIDANDTLVARLDDTLARVKNFRDERVATAKRMRARAAELDAEIKAVPPRRQ
jgi:DNA-binding transcriptional MerR regulator